MIRAVAIFSLSTMLLLVLYLPSTHPPERFVQQMEQEHRHASEMWGYAIAERILERAMAMTSHAGTASPIPTRDVVTARQPASGRIGEEMAQINRRLFDNAYFRSIEALLELASYRLSALVEWAPKSALLTFAILVDSIARRAIKAHEFTRHDPELFALCLCVAIILSCACAIALALPVSIHPMIWATAPFA
ncbi:MAG TPA: DUF4400 domain-containing protein, partial [Pseudorhodoferax sp.]|nr:DUF4400 domain-containing protein [Pseudorhodoferax sp.]